MAIPLVGISGFAAHVPPYRVSLADWCQWTGNDPAKIRAVVGNAFRMRGPEQSVYTMAATAVLRLIVNYEVDPGRVRYLALGTESSTDNSAGAVIVRGMVDQALRELGRPPLTRSCEVPEFKHACLGGIYAMKSALRYLAVDGADAQAIVVSADIAEYARGSTGEQTQGAGALAMLLEREPRIAALDLSGAGSSSSYRGPDFRKPMLRFAGQKPGPHGRLTDFPLFNGKLSTACYAEATIRALTDMFERRRIDPANYLRSVDRVFMHRPYQRMPETGLALAYLFALGAGASADLDELAAYCSSAEVDLDAMLAEMTAPAGIAERAAAGELRFDAYPLAMRALRAFRETPGFKELVLDKMTLGVATMAELGNLYTAALPAWLAAGFEEAAHADTPLAGREILAVGYGSGDAAEALPLQIVDGWQGAARRIGLADALSGSITLSRSQYERLHDTGSAGIARNPSNEFVVTGVGSSREDAGIEYYAWRPESR